MTETGFYGRRLRQKLEDRDKVVEFAGVVFDVSQNVLRTRVRNANCVYHDDGSEDFLIEKFRFGSAKEFLTQKTQKGQVYAHVC